MLNIDQLNDEALYSIYCTKLYKVKNKLPHPKVNFKRKHLIHKIKKLMYKEYNDGLINYPESY
jgi:hypothetical protein